MCARLMLDANNTQMSAAATANAPYRFSQLRDAMENKDTPAATVVEGLRHRSKPWLHWFSHRIEPR
jgi:hypothetical protein